ncbi:MAG: hypothetical protein ACI4ET_11335 [Bilifractor sp.]
MTTIMQRSHELRDDPNIHYNCAQEVFIPFAEKKPHCDNMVYEAVEIVEDMLGF